MDKIYNYVYADLTSFEDLKNILVRDLKRLLKGCEKKTRNGEKKKNNERKWLQGVMNEKSHLTHHPQ